MNELALASFAAASDAHLVGEPRSARFAAFKASFDGQAELARLGVLGYRFLARSDPVFPPLLGAIHDPPPGLFLRGDADVELLSRPAVAIVGARACSAYGRQVARSLGRDLAAAGLIVVSGLARGIDAEAHRGALEASGSTVAVLGCGIDRDYPAAHRELARQVAATGLVVSEYAPGVEPAPWRFPARNRIVAGLCAATVVVEARERSGALITADFALEEGREVFAVPGEITSALSAGSNGLLRLGATPLTSAEDVLESYGIAVPAAAPVDVGRRPLPCSSDSRGCCGRRRAGPRDRTFRGRAGCRPDRARARGRREGGGRCLSRCPLASPRGRLFLARRRRLRRSGLEPLPGRPTSQIVGGGVTGISARSRSRAWASACGCTRRARSPPARAAATVGLPSAAGRWHTTAHASGSAPTSLRTTGD